jgi:predicted transcriptional regulator
MVEVRHKGEHIIRKEVLLEGITKLELNKRQKKALLYLVDNTTIARAEYAKMFTVSLRTANYDLDQMQKLKLIVAQDVGRSIRYALAPAKSRNK